MVNPNPLARAVATVFGTFELLLLFTLPLFAITELLPTNHSYVYGVLTFARDVDLAAGTSTSVKVNLSQARVAVENTKEDPELRSVIRSGFPSQLSLAGIGIVVCDLLRRLCRNVERGEVFCAANLKLMRTLGAVMMASSILFTISVGWRDYQVATYVSRHTNLQPQSPFAPHALLTHLDFGSLLIGLVVLVLTEVFRQGLALKRESDLTV